MDVLSAKGFRGTWKTTVATAEREWMVKTMSDMAMKYEDWLRGCVHHDGRKGNVYLPCDMVLAIADWIEAHRDVAPVRHGRWNPHPIMGYKEWDVCSECGIGVKRREYGVGDDGREWVEEYQYVFCPNCGAKMDGGGEE